MSNMHWEESKCYTLLGLIVTIVLFSLLFIGLNKASWTYKDDYTGKWRDIRTYDQSSIDRLRESTKKKY